MVPLLRFERCRCGKRPVVDSELSHSGCLGLGVSLQSLQGAKNCPLVQVRDRTIHCSPNVELNHFYSVGTWLRNLGPLLGSLI